MQRTWLWGQRSERPALLLSFAAPGQPLDRSLVPGMALDAELVFFPSAYPLRALIKQRHATPAALDLLPGYANLLAAARATLAAARDDESHALEYLADELAAQHGQHDLNPSWWDEVGQ